MNIFGLLKFIADHPLSQGGRAAAIGRFVKRQPTSRIIGNPIALPFVGTTKLLTETGFGYAACHYAWRERRLSPVREDKSNTISVRDLNAMNEVCRSARRYQLVGGDI